ncbi:MAG: DedA family protein [Lachnospiraceae bacterium]|nr:DedA family protein [Lachnospiraceae bacterium]
MDTLLNFLSRYGLAAMFLIILLEYACFPVSSEIVLPFSGAVASLQSIPFYVILPASIAAGLLGTSICYFAGRFGGNALLARLCRKFPKMQKGLDASREKFEKYGAFAVCIGRLIPICRTYIAFFAGTACQPPAIFFGASAIGITIWNTVLIGVGYLLRENWSEAAAAYTKYKDILIPALLILLLILFAFKKGGFRKSQKSRPSMPSDSTL